MLPVTIPDRTKLAALLFAVVLLIAGASSLATEAPDRVRDVLFTYRTVITVGDPAARHRLEAWIPLPRDDRFQTVSALSIDSPVRTRIVDQHHDGNRILYLEAGAPLPPSIPVTVHFRVHRIEQSADLAKAQRDPTGPMDAELAGFLRPDALVPTGGRIAQVSAAIGERDASPYQQADAIYRWVIANMKYDKSGIGWGRGDALYACDVKKGNCTDFHSLFIALARSRGIPARFTIGFPLDAAKSGAISGYHCWAEFYAGGQWVPIDASEAWKHPARRDYYFGHLDADRVAFTMGRDLVLKPRQHGEPLNYLIYPYVEIDGQPLPPAQVRNQFEYADAGPVH